MSGTPAREDLAPFHHPNFRVGELAFRADYGSAYNFQFAPFTGDEPEARQRESLRQQLTQDDWNSLRADDLRAELARRDVVRDASLDTTGWNIGAACDYESP